MSDGYVMTGKDIGLYLTIIRLYEQQQYMYDNRIHSVVHHKIIIPLRSTAKRFVTSTDIAIEDRVVSSSFVMIRPAPLQRFSVLKNLSTSILSVLSWYSSLRGWTEPV